MWSCCWCFICVIPPRPCNLVLTIVSQAENKGGNLFSSQTQLFLYQPKPSISGALRQRGTSSLWCCAMCSALVGFVFSQHSPSWSYFMSSSSSPTHRFGCSCKNCWHCWIQVVCCNYTGHQAGINNTTGTSSVYSTWILYILMTW